MTSARGMNEQERVLTQLPLRTQGRRGRSCAPAGERAGASRTPRPAYARAGVREPGAGDLSRSEERSMERRTVGACLALLWGCALVAAAAQGKEGERVRPDPARRRDP